MCLTLSHFLFALLLSLLSSSFLASAAALTTVAPPDAPTGARASPVARKLDCPKLKEFKPVGDYKKSRLHLEPLLHECLRRDPVDPWQLPVVVCHVLQAFIGLNTCRTLTQHNIRLFESVHLAGRAVFSAESRVRLQLQLARSASERRLVPHEGLHKTGVV